MKFLPKSLILLLAGVVWLMTACSLPQVSAEERIFLGLSLNYQGAYALPTTVQQEVGSLAALTYDRQQDRFYAVSQSESGPILNTLTLMHPDQPGDVEVEIVSQDGLKTVDGQLWDNISATGLATNSEHLYLAGSRDRTDPTPMIAALDLTTGDPQQPLELPPYFFSATEPDQPERGVTPQAGLTALTINPEGDRLFAATSRPLLQDTGAPSDRLLHYWIGEPEPIYISQHRYPLETANHRLAALATVDSGGHFLALEELATGGEWQILQVATGGATDISRVPALQGDLSSLVPVQKLSLLTSSDFDAPSIQHVQSMTLGGYNNQGGRNLLILAAGPDSQMLLQFQLVSTR